MTPEEAIEIIHEKHMDMEFYFAEHDRYPKYYDFKFDQATLIAAQALKEIQQYREIGTVEECNKAVKEEDALKFYYCESEDDYYIGKRVGNFYYAKYGETGFEWFMSRYLPWGEHVIAPNTLWKEHIYPSEPKEIPFFEWLQGFIKRYCGGTVEECREAVEKQKQKTPIKSDLDIEESVIKFYECPNCGDILCDMPGNRDKYCRECGQAIRWPNERPRKIKSDDGEVFI